MKAGRQTGRIKPDRRGRPSGRPEKLLVAGAADCADVIDFDFHKKRWDVAVVRRGAARRADRGTDNFVGSFYIATRSFELSHEAAFLLTSRFEFDLRFLECAL